MQTSLIRVAELVKSETFLSRHRRDEGNFTRRRKLPFKTVLAMTLQKSVKSLQVVLNEWCRGSSETISASALSQARQKFRHTAFIELLEEAVVKPTYEKPYKSFKGHRLLAIDGTTLHLPTSRELIHTFGTVKYLNGKQKVACDNVESKVSVLYDVLNQIPLSGEMHRARTNDIKASATQLELLRPGDIVMADRGYGSYGFFAKIRQKQAEFIIRLKDRTYRDHHQFFSDRYQNDTIVDVPLPLHLRNVDQLPRTQQIRFIRVELPDGEVEVLATSLLDRRKYPTKVFKRLYYLRWRIETFFQVIKSRLAVENFTGRTVEAIRQDFYSTLFVSGLETILTTDANKKLRKKKTVHTQQVNKAVSFHAIKDRILLLISDPPDDFERQVQRLFLLNPTLKRPNRPKNKERLSLKSNLRSLHFQKFARKAVF